MGGSLSTCMHPFPASPPDSSFSKLVAAGLPAEMKGNDVAMGKSEWSLLLQTNGSTCLTERVALVTFREIFCLNNNQINCPF